MADRTSADVCKRVVTILDKYLIHVDEDSKEVMKEVVEMFYEYDFNMYQAFWSDKEQELAAKWGICLICDIIDCGITEEDHDDYGIT